MKRQGLQISIRELVYLTNELVSEELGEMNIDRRFQVNIINKKDESDTWELEK